MIPVQELRTWISGLDQSGFVGVDEGGLTLVEIRDDEHHTGDYIEVGGYDDDLEPAVDTPSPRHSRHRP